MLENFRVQLTRDTLSVFSPRDYLVMVRLFIRFKSITWKLGIHGIYDSINSPYEFYSGICILKSLHTPIFIKLHGICHSFSKELKGKGIGKEILNIFFCDRSNLGY